MNPTRRRRLLLVLLLVVASAVAVTLVALALQRNVAYLYTPAEVLRGDAGEQLWAASSDAVDALLRRQAIIDRAGAAAPAPIMPERA